MLQRFGNVHTHFDSRLSQDAQIVIRAQAGCQMLNGSCSQRDSGSGAPAIIMVDVCVKQEQMPSMLLAVQSHLFCSFLCRGEAVTISGWALDHWTVYSRRLRCHELDISLHAFAKPVKDKLCFARPRHHGTVFADPVPFDQVFTIIGISSIFCW